MRKFLPRMFTIIVLFVYMFTIVFQHMPFLRLFTGNNVFAEAPSEKTNLVLLLADSEIYKGSVKSEIDWYAKDYIQANFVNTKAIILPLDIKTIKSYDIVKIIQNIYFDGQKDVVTDLQGIVLLGDVPLPVIEKKGFLLPSIYPYVDIEKPSFVYDDTSRYFKHNGKLGEAEIWHSVIQFNSEDNYLNYFGKLKTYNDKQNSKDGGEDTTGKPQGADMYFEDFQEAQNSINEDNIVFYLNKTIWAEDISYGRITKHLVDYMKTHNEDGTNAAMEDFSKGLDAGTVAETKGNDTTDVLFGMDSGEADNFKTIQDGYNSAGAVFNNMFVEPTDDEIAANNKNIEDTKENIPTKTLKSAVDKYTKNYSSIFGGGYGNKLRTQLETSEKYSWNNTNSVVKLVDLKDKLSVDMIKSANTAMENLIDERVDEEEYYMKRLVQHLIYNNGAYWSERCHDVDTHWETFYFGLNAKHLEKARDLTILRGTHGNYENLDMMGGTISAHKGTAPDKANQGGEGTGKPILRFNKPGSSYCGGGKAYINIECGSEVTLYTIPSTASRYEGTERFIWNPVSESDGNLVIKLPEKYPSTCNTALYCKPPSESPSSLQESGRFEKRDSGYLSEPEDDWEASEERVKKSVASSFGFNNLQTQSNRGYNFVNGGCQEDKMVPPSDLSSIVWLDHDISGWEVKSDLSVNLEGNLINLEQDITTILSEGYTGKGSVGNPWIIFPKDCKRYATTFERMRPYQKKKLKRAVAGDHFKHFDVVPAEWRPTEGVTYGFIVSGLVRMGSFDQATRDKMRSTSWVLAENGAGNNIRSEISWYKRGSTGDSKDCSTESEGNKSSDNKPICTKTDNKDIVADFLKAIEGIISTDNNALQQLSAKLLEMGYDADAYEEQGEYIDKINVNGKIYDVLIENESWNAEPILVGTAATPNKCSPATPDSGAAESCEEECAGTSKCKVQVDSSYGSFTGLANGCRPHYRFGKSGADYCGGKGQTCTVKVTGCGGDIEDKTYTFTNPGNPPGGGASDPGGPGRYEEGSFLWKAVSEGDGNLVIILPKEFASTDDLGESGVTEEMIAHMEDKYLIDVERFDPKCSTVRGNYFHHKTCTDYGKIESKEDVNYWAGRIFGGYSPINVNQSSISGGATGKGTSKGNLNQVRFSGAGGSSLDMPTCVSTGPVVPDGADYKKAWSPNVTTKNGRLWDLAGTTALQACTGEYPQDAQSSNGSNYGDKGGAIRADSGHLCGEDPQAYYSVDAYRNYKSVRVTQYWCLVDFLAKQPDWHFHNYPNAGGPFNDFVHDFDSICPENKCEIYQQGDVIELVKCDVEHDMGPYEADLTDPVPDGSESIERYRKYPCEDIDDDMFFNFWDTRLVHKSPLATEFNSMEVATLARPIDTERYINFQGIGGDEVKLVYPDLWQVKVYNGTSLMSPDEIADEIELYLEELSENYIEQLETQLENSEAYCEEKAIDRDDIIGVGGAQDGDPEEEGETIGNVYDLLEPLASPCNRDYEIPEPDFLYKALGEETIASIAETLHWMNLGWADKSKQPGDPKNRDMEIDYYYDDFDVNEKVEYLSEHMTSADPYLVKGVDLKKNVMNFPDFPAKGYDVGFIGSNGNESLTSSGSPSRDKTSNQASSDRQSSKFTNEMMEDAEDAESCGVSSDGTVPLFEWPDAISCRLDQTLSKPFEIRNTSECSWSSDDEFEEYGYHDKESLSKVVAANKKVGCAVEESDILYVTNKEADGKKQNKSDQERYAFYSEVTSNLLIRSNDTFFSNAEYTGNITIEGDTNNLDITAYSEGVTCLWLDQGNSYENLCNGVSLDLENNWKFPIAFYNLDNDEGKTTSTKAGDRYLNFKVCKTSNTSLCIRKTVILEKVAGDISYIEINPYSDSMIWGGTMPVVIKAYDQDPNIYPDANEVTAVPYVYDITIDPNLINIYKGAINIADTSFARDEKVLWLKASDTSVSGVNKFTLKLKLADEWKEMYPNVLAEKSYTFNIYSKDNLEDSEVTLTPSLTEKYRIPKDPYDLTNETLVGGVSYGIYSYDKSKLVKLNIKPILPDGSVLKNTVTIKDINGIFVPGNIKDTSISVLSGNNTLTTTYPKFSKKEEFLINSDNGIDIRLVPTLRTGISKLKISIPGMKDHYIYYRVYSPGINDVEFTFEEPIIEENATTTGRIKLLDALGNIVTESYEIDTKGNYSDTIEGSITLGGGLVFEDGSDIKIFSTSDGLYEFDIVGKESGYATVAVTYYEKGVKKTLEKSQEIQVKKTSISLDKNLNILYLSIFGSNWWDDVQDISNNSDTNLSITTMIVDPEMLKQYNFIFHEDFRITDNIGINKKMFFEDGNMKIDLGEDPHKPDARFIIKDTIDFKVEEIATVNDISLDDIKDGIEIYYLPEPTDDIITSNSMKNSKLYINSEKSIDIETGWQSNNINIKYDIIAHEDYGYSAWQIYMGKDKLLGRFFIKADLPVENVEAYVSRKLERITKDISNIYAKQISNVSQIKNDNNDNEVSLFYIPVLSSGISKNYMNNKKVYIAKKSANNPNPSPSVYIDINTGTWNKSIRSVYDEELYIKYGYPARKIYLDNVFVGTFFLESDLYLDNYNFLVDTTYGEGTTNGMKGVGFYSYEHDDYTFQQYDSAEKYDDPNMKIGFTSDFRNITDWAGGATVGEATKKYSSEFVINFGDALLKTPVDSADKTNAEAETQENQTMVESLEEDNTGFSDFNSNLGDKIFTDMRGSIKKVLTIDFNKDGLKDFIIVYNNNSIRLLKKFKGEEPFKDIGDLMIVSDGIKDVFVGDAKGDGFEDIFVLLKNDSFRYYENQVGKFDLHGIPVCLDIYGGPNDLNIEQIYAKYVDNDKKIDFIVNDKNGHIKTFYGDTYLSTDIMKCDANWQSRLKQETVKNYGIQINKDVKFIDDGYIYRSDLDVKESNALSAKNKLADMPAAEVRSDTLPLDQANYLQENNKRFAFQEFPSEYGPATGVVDNTVEYNFKKATFLDSSDPITIYKTIEKVYEGKEYDGGIIAGDITILKASNESNITDYVLYWGASSYEKLVGYDAIDEIPKTGSNMKYTFNANTQIPEMATHILVYTKNKEGEMATGKGVVLLQMGIPRKSASAIGFTSITINNANTLSGKLRVLKAQDESNITDYVLYWGKNESKKLKGYNAIAKLKKTGDDLEYQFSSERIPDGATHILVYSKNTYGEMAEGIGVQIVEKKNATVKAKGITFSDTDTDGQEIGGTVNITKAANEGNIEYYILYWGMGEDEKLENQPIKSIPKTGSNLKYIFEKNTQIPVGATHLLVYTKSNYGEMFEGVSTMINDSGPPKNASNGVVLTEDLLPGDIVKVTVHLDGSGKKFTYLEALKGPFEVQKNQDGDVPLEFDTEDSNAIVSSVESYPKFIFKLDNFTGREVSYYAKYKGESPVNTVIDDKTGNVKIYTKGGCSKGFEEYDGSSVEYTDLKTKMQEKVGNIQEDRDDYVDEIIEDSEEQEFGDLMNKVESVGYNESSTFNMDSSFTATQDTITISDDEITSKFEDTKEVVDDVLGGLCKGFGFGAGECGNVSIPCNMAFLSPGITNICGCPLQKDYGTPIFYYPGTLYVAGAAIPVPNMLKDASTDDFYWAAGGKYSSVIRIYLSPTLTQGLGLAVCFGDYGESMEEPETPFGTIMGNCIVVAGNIPLPGCNNDGGEDSGYGSPSGNSDNTIEDRMNDLLNMGSCSEVPGASGTNTYSSTALSMGGGSSYSSSSMYSDMTNGTVEINGETAVKFESNANTIDSQEDVDVLLEGGVPITLKIQSSNSKGLVKCIVQSWRNRQLEFIMSNFTSMTIYVIYPDLGNITEGFGDLFDKLENVDNLLGDTFDSTTSDLKSAMGDFGFGESNPGDISKAEKELSKITPAAKGLKTLGKAISNPFENLKSYFESIPLVDMQTQTLVMQIPWIGKDEISRQIAYLNGWKKRNKAIIEARKSIGVEGSITAQFEEMLANIDKNVEILYMYIDFPKEVYKYMHLLDYYLTQILCIVEKLVNMVVGRLDTNSRRFEKWVDTIILLIAIIDTWQILIDFSVDWKTSCGQCKQDNADLHDCILSIFCFDLPVLPIPPFKIPDITIDLSHINLGIDILLPELKIKPVAVELFQLPDLPEVPPLAGEVSIDLPEVPLLPEPPDLNIDLFELPEVPYIKLPNLPPAPELPELMPTIKVVLNILKVISRYYCIIKNGIGLVAEWDTKSRIEQLTQRRNRVDPFDFLKINFPSLPYYGVDLKVDGYLNFRIELDQIYELVEKFTEDINDKTNEQIGELEDIDYEFLDIDVPDPLEDIDTTIEENVDLDNSYKKGENSTEQAWRKNVHGKMDLAQANQVLYDELDFFIGEFDEDYMRASSKKLQEMARKVQNMITGDKNVQANKKGVREIGDKVTEKLQEQRNYLSRIEEMLKRLENGETDILDEYKDVIYEEDTTIEKVNLLSEVVIEKETTIYETPLFTMDEEYIEVLAKAKSPKVSYLEINKKMLTRLSEKVEEKLEFDSSYMTTKHKIDKTLNLINSELQVEINRKNINYATESANNLPPADPTNNIRGLYVLGEETENYYSVMTNKEKAQEIRKNKTYFLEDINGDNKKDIVWRDAQYVYIKYKGKGQEIKVEGTSDTKLYSYKKVIKKVEDVIDSEGYIKVQGDKFKIWSQSQSNSTLQVRGQDPETVRLTWEADTNKDTNAYLIMYSNRIDILNDIEKKYNYNTEIVFDQNTYKGGAVLYYDSQLNKQMIPEADWSNTDFTEVSLPQETEKYTLFRDVGTTMDTMPVRDFSRIKNHVAILHNIGNIDWSYFRVYPVKLTVYGKDKFKIENLSMYSNQVVGGSQVSSDDSPPEVDVTLRKYEEVDGVYQTGDIVGEGLYIDANINTRYVLETKWYDNLGEIRTSYLLNERKRTLCKDCSIYGTGDTSKIISSYPGPKTYYLIGEDQNDNVTNIELVINYQAPSLSIESVDLENGRITAEFADKMDEPMIKFLRERDGKQEFVENENLKDYFTDTNKEGLEIIGSTFNTDTKIVFYKDGGDKSVSLGWLDTSNGEIYIDSKYVSVVRKAVDFTDNEMNVDIYGSDKVIYRFNLPGKKLVSDPSIFDGAYKLQAVESSNMGDFNNGWCILDIVGNQCAMYITVKGNVYVPDEYKTSLVGQHSYDATGEDITIEVYKGSLSGKKVFEWTYKLDDIK